MSSNDFYELKEKPEKFKILIVDDSEYERDMFKDLLVKDYDILEAGNGKEAIDMLTLYGEDIALVLLDLIMPEIDGFGVLLSMRKMGWSDRIPVIMISSETSSDMVQHAYEMGVTDYIGKNIKRAIINKRIENTINLYAKKERMIRFMSEENKRIRNTDPLTGLLNLNGFIKKATELIKKYPDKPYAITFVDIRGFKYINDFYGVDTGNELLKYWAGLLKEIIGDDEALARIAADRIVTISYLDDEKRTLDRYYGIHEKMSKFLDRPGRSFNIELVAGTYVLEEADRQKADIEQYISHAMVAHERAKNTPGGMHDYYNEGEWQTQWRTMQISNHLEAAIENGEITVWFQPQYNFSNKNIVSAEALCRWNHEELGWISPGEFIPILEKSGQIYKLDCHVWRLVCRFLKEFKDRELKTCPHVSINVSRADINQEKSPDVVIENLVKEYGLSPDVLHVEITESAYVEDSERINHLVKSFHEKGFNVEMDDFGSGYSSLNSLQNIDVDVLKMDMGFLKNAEGNNKSSVILDGMIQMAKNLSIQVVAEGVETESQAKFLGNLGCNIMQGYYFSRPIPVEQFIQLLYDVEKNHESTDVESNQDNISSGNTIEDYRDYLRKRNDGMIAEMTDEHSLSSFIFNNYMGSAAIIEIGNEGYKIISVNKEFLKELGLVDDYVVLLHNKEFNFFTEEERKGIVEMLELAREREKVSMSMYLEVCKAIIRFDLSHLFVNGDVTYSIIRAHNVNNKALEAEARESNKTKLENSVERFNVLSRMPGFASFEYKFKMDVLLAEVTSEGGYHYETSLDNFLDTMEINGLVSEDSAEKIRNVIYGTRNKVMSEGMVRARFRFKGDFFHSYRCIFTTIFTEDGEPDRLVGYATSIDSEEKDIIRWRDLASKDSMTGLLNHEAVSGTIASMLDSGEKGALVYLDIDNFKKINDVYGHLYGDTIINEFTEVLVHSSREYDIIGRMGGDEFIMFLPGMIESIALTKKLGELRDRLNSIRVGDYDNLNCSMGAVICRSSGLSFEEALKAADEEMYKAKNTGKNKFCISVI